MAHDARPPRRALLALLPLLLGSTAEAAAPAAVTLATCHDESDYGQGRRLVEDLRLEAQPGTGGRALAAVVAVYQGTGRGTGQASAREFVMGFSPSRWAGRGENGW